MEVEFSLLAVALTVEFPSKFAAVVTSVTLRALSSVWLGFAVVLSEASLAVVVLTAAPVISSKLVKRSLSKFVFHRS